jgi:hypothetical protein
MTPSVVNSNGAGSDAIPSERFTKACAIINNKLVVFNNSKYWLRYTFGFAQIEIENWMTSEVLSSALPLIYIAA